MSCNIYYFERVLCACIFCKRLLRNISPKLKYNDIWLFLRKPYYLRVYTIPLLCTAIITTPW